MKKFFKGLWRLIKSMGTIKGLISLFLSFMIYVGWAIVLLIIGIIIGDAWLISVGTGTILFWAGPFTPMWMLIIGTAIFIQRFILRDKKAISKKEIFSAFKGGEIMDENDGELLIHGDDGSETPNPTYENDN